MPTSNPASATVASLVPAATDLILGMGAADHLIAISNWDPQIPQLAGLPRVGDYRTIDWEKIAELHPTHMIVQFAPDKMPPGLADKAANLHIQLVNIRIYRLDDIYTAIDQLGSAINETAKAAAARQHLKDSLDTTARRVAGKAAVRTLIVDSDSELATVGGGNYLDDLLTIAGGQNVITGGENSYPTIDREKLLVLNPDVVIVLLPAASPQVIDQAKQFWAALPQLSAVANHKVYILTEPYLLLPGMDVTKVAAQFANLLHPDAATTQSNHGDAETRSKEWKTSERLFAHASAKESRCFSPSPGNPGEGRGEGLALQHADTSESQKTLTLTLSRITGRGDQTNFFASSFAPFAPSRLHFLSDSPRPSASPRLRGCISPQRGAA